MGRTFVALLFCGALFAQETPRDGAGADTTAAPPTREGPAPTGADRPGGADGPQTRARGRNSIHAGERSWKTISKRWTRGAGGSGDDERNGFSERGRLLPTAGDETKYKVMY